jgi:hypothetical protein
MALDTSFNLIRTAGKNGMGPGELQSASFFSVYKDTIYALGSLNKINVYDNQGMFKREISLTDFHIVPRRFCINNNAIFIAAYDDGKAIVKADLKGKELKNFGSFHPSTEAKHGVGRNFRFLINGNEGEIFSVPLSDPIVEKFSANGELLWRADLSENEYLKEIVAFKKSQDKNTDGINPFFQDVYYKDDKLYLLYIENTANKSACNKVLVLSDFSGKPESGEVLSLADGDEMSWYITFFVYQNSIYAYEGGHGEIHKFIIQ